MIYEILIFYAIFKLFGAENSKFGAGEIYNYNIYIYKKQSKCTYYH